MIEAGPPATDRVKADQREAGPSEIDEFEAWQMHLHGHRVIYHMAGSGPAVVLIHGMLNSSRHWRSVALALADRYTVVAPDLIGHGDSATPRGDYSLGAHATSIRDLLAVLGVERATIVGHSLGGGVAMQFFYQFPQRTERLVLVSSGGLGREVSPLLRSATLPGAGALLSLAAHPRLLATLRLLGDRMRASGSRQGVYVQAIARALQPLEQPGARKAFLHTLRAVIDVQGQRVSAQDRLYLLAGMPTLIVWGERDNTIPPAHGSDAHRAAPGSRLATLPGAAHFPHLEDPEGLAAILGEFLASTAPALIEDGDWGGIVAPRAPRSRRAVASAA
jgi:pimeloyl-ACP methyl ester carboxylesterase